MKSNSIFILFIVLVLGLSQCKTTDESSAPMVYNDTLQLTSDSQMLISFKNGKSFNHPTYVIWEEDMNGNYQRTLFITKNYASGIFGYQMIGDSVWVNEAGSSYQPAALPYWTYKKGFIHDKQLIPTPEHPFVDAYAGATPQQNFQFKTGAQSKKESYRILLEVNQAWDWNSYWTNDKYPDNAAYKHAAQPSVIYSVVINREDIVYYMNPIGHADPKGESGKLFTNLSTLTTAKEIFESIKIEIIK